MAGFQRVRAPGDSPAEVSRASCAALPAPCVLQRLKPVRTLNVIGPDTSRLGLGISVNIRLDLAIDGAWRQFISNITLSSKNRNISRSHSQGLYLMTC